MPVRANLRLALLCIVLQLSPWAASAGPPYLTDDPAPTDYRHFEIYVFSDGIHNRGGTSSDLGIDFNYGGAGVRYDVNDKFHLLAYGSAGVQNADSEHQYSWYAAMLFTF
jgi:hypothetical protein